MSFPAFTGAWWGWFLTGAGFFLTAAGLPISSLALFVFAVSLSNASGLTWQEAAAFAGSATVAGHLASYHTFRWAGKPAMNFLERLWPGFPPLINKAQEYLGRSWPTTLVLRWVGTGYTQVFWLMGLSRRSFYPAIVVFFLNDYAWATFWCASVAYAANKVPLVQHYLLWGALILLFGSTGVLLVAHARRA